MAEIFDVFASGMLHPVAGHSGLGPTFRRARGGDRNVFLLPEITADHLLACGGLRLVLSFDGIFCSLAGVSHRPGGILASMDFLVC